VNRLRAVIFDFNGVLVDDEALHAEAFIRAMATVGISLTHAAYVSDYLGLDDRECMGAVLKDFECSLAPVELETLFETKCGLYLELLAQTAPFFPGAVQCVEKWSKSVTLAINSGALTHEIEILTERAGIRSCFSALVGADQVPRGKPDPIGYLTALERLRGHTPDLADLQPEQCLVIEDAPRGIRAARAAGMRCLGIGSSRPLADLHQADQAVQTLEEVDLDRLRAIMARP